MYAVSPWARFDVKSQKPPSRSRLVELKHDSDVMRLTLRVSDKRYSLD